MILFFFFYEGYWAQGETHSDSAEMIHSRVMSPPVSPSLETLLKSHRSGVCGGLMGLKFCIALGIIEIFLFSISSFFGMAPGGPHK